ncbi:MAG: hypothetical protein H6747_06650 [Deltaproteobacteria bacterium]|nr:hypothetical protein [Deltaproteobacteria bacterium]
MNRRLRHVAALTGTLLTLVLALGSAGCSRAFFSHSGDAAHERGETAQALVDWLQARRRERHLMNARERRALDEKITAAIDRLSVAAIQGAERAMRSGDGDRALDILLPLYAGKGLWRHYPSDGIEAARARVVGEIREALSVAAGIDLQALTGDSGAIDEAGARIRALGQRLQIVPRRYRGPLSEALSDLAGPTLERGWDLVRSLLGEERTLEAYTLAERLAGVLPDDRSQAARRDSARSHARQIHERRAAKVCGTAPGLCWAELELARRFGGRGGDAVRAQLRRVHYDVGSVTACSELQSGLRSALKQGSGGVGVTLTVQFGPCQQRADRWQTRKRVSWIEERIREVPYVETYTTYESQRKCEYYQRYANQTCTTSYVGNGYSRRTCRNNYTTAQRCRNVSVPVKRTRRGIRRVVDRIRHTITRVIDHERHAFAVSGTIAARWPGGETTLPFRYANQSEDSGYDDKAGRDPLSVTRVPQMRSAAIAAAAKLAHGLDQRALQPLAQSLRGKADEAAGRGDAVGAVDLALQAYLVGAGLHGSDAGRIAQVLKLPAEVAGGPGTWGRHRAVRLVAKNGASKAPARKARRATPAYDPLAALVGGEGSRAGGDASNIDPKRLVDPELPEPDRATRRRYEALSETAFVQERERDESYLELRLHGGPTVTRPSLLGLRLGADAVVFGVARFEAGGEIDPLNLGIGGLHFGAMIGTWKTEEGALTGFGLRYERQDTATTSHSALNVRVAGRGGGRFGFWWDFNLNLARWFGDDALAHYHPLGAGLFLDFVIGRIEAGGYWYAGGGGVRWTAALVFRI